MALCGCFGRSKKMPKNDLVARAQVETHKLDLMAENSSLKLRLATVEKDKQEAEERLVIAQRRIDDLQSRLNERTIEVADLRARLMTRATPTSTPSSPDRTDSFRDKTLDKEKTLERLKRKHSEVEKLKRAVDCLMVCNEEKDRHIEELGRVLKQYRHVEDMVGTAAAPPRMRKDQLGVEEDHSDSSSTKSSSLLDRNTEHTPMDRPDIIDGADGHLLHPGATSTPVNHHHHQMTSGSPHVVANGNHSSPALTPPSTIMNAGSPSPRKSPTIGRSSSFEDLPPQASKTPPSVRSIRGQGYGTLPKDARLNLEGVAMTPPHHTTSPLVYHPTNDHSNKSKSSSNARPPLGSPTATLVVNPQPPGGGNSNLSQRPPLPAGANYGSTGRGVYDKPPTGATSTPPRKPRHFMSFGKGFFKAKSGRWSTSAPNLDPSDQCMVPRLISINYLVNKGPTSNLADNEPTADAQTEAEEEALKDEMAQQYKQMQQGGGPELTRKKSKGFKRFFGKLRRSSSQDLDKENLEEFKRNGLRSTAGARLGWSKDLTLNDVPFARWDTERVSMWLHAVGLSMYVGQCKRWVKNGAQLVKASNHDLEKELGMRNHFHRKKLQLALQKYGATGDGADATKPTNMDLIDHNFVTRWLDDIGLPQYKDAFSEARIDGRMLHYLTVEDLMHLRVTNALHHLSIKAGILVLRRHNFSQGCLKRRPSPDEGQLQDCPEEVSLWTNHRVMEWLRSIDLSEYAPNLRGSGVHGGLMVCEAQFSAEIFASILSIPSSKTLLRRHLNTHFVALIGSNTQMEKRKVECQPGFTPLTPNQKVKLKKFGIFSHKRTRSLADEDLVCPISQSEQQENSNQNGGPSLRRDGTFPREDRENMLARDHNLLDEVPTSDV